LIIGRRKYEISRFSIFNARLFSGFGFSDGTFYIQTRSRAPARKIVAMREWLKHYAVKNGFTYLDY